MTVRPAAFVIISLAATAALGQELPAVDPPPELLRVLRAYEEAWSRKDSAALAALFTEDGFVMANGRTPVRGRASIEKHYAGSGGPLALRAFAYGIDGSTAYILGGFSRNKGEPDLGKFTLVLRRGADGQWRIVSDMDNPNAPPRRP